MPKKEIKREKNFYKCENCVATTTPPHQSEQNRNSHIIPVLTVKRAIVAYILRIFKFLTVILQYNLQILMHVRTL